MISEPKGKTFFSFSMTVFPSGHSILLPRPSGQRHRDLISLPLVTFSDQLFRSPMRRHVPIFSCSLNFTRRHVWVRDLLSSAEIPSLGSSDAVLLIHPSNGPPRAFLLHLFGNFGSAAPPSIPFDLQQHLFPFAESCVCLGKASSSSPVTFLQCLSHFFFISSSTAVIRPPIKAFVNPNVIQSPIKWLWQLKILCLHMLSLGLLLSHQKN